MATIWRLWNPGGKKRRKTRRRRSRRNPFLTIARSNPFLTIPKSNPVWSNAGGRKRRKTRRRRSYWNPTGVPYSGATLRPRRRSGSRPRYTRIVGGLNRQAFIRLPKRLRGMGLTRFARYLAPRGGKRKLLARCRKSRSCRRASRRGKR
jgi:hypothetical protein